MTQSPAYMVVSVSSAGTTCGTPCETIGEALRAARVYRAAIAATACAGIVTILDRSSVIAGWYRLHNAWRRV